VAAGVSGILLAFIFIVALNDVNKLPAPTKVDNNIGMIENLGKVLYTDYMLPFEMSAVLFLAGMVGAVMLGKKETA
jgi:NADH-quinone oxidoreductase subunit J